VDDRQKKALTGISLLLVVAGTAFVLWLAGTVLQGTARGNQQPGRIFMLLIADWNTTAGVFKALPILISLGLAGFGAYKIKDWLFYTIVGFSLGGLIASGYLFFEVTSVTTAKEFWAYSPTDKLQDYESFVAAAKVGLGVFCGWFIGVIAAELGVRLGA
jgi:hypothetical protein